MTDLLRYVVLSHLDIRSPAQMLERRVLVDPVLHNDGISVASSQHLHIIQQSFFGFRRYQHNLGSVLAVGVVDDLLVGFVSVVLPLEMTLCSHCADAVILVALVRAFLGDLVLRLPAVAAWRCQRVSHIAIHVHAHW